MTLWLDIKSVPSGLPGPVLQEHQGAYQDLPSFPRTIMVIGNRQSKSEYIDIPWIQQSGCGVYFQGLDNTTVLIECNLHLTTHHERLRGSYLLSQVDTYCLNGIPGSKDATISWRVYSHLIAPFSTLVLIFADDFGGLQEISKQVADWVCCYTSSIGITTKPLLMIASKNPISKMQSQMVFDETLIKLRKIDPTQPPTFADAKRKVLERFEEVQLLELQPNESLLQQLLRHSDKIYSARKDANQALSAIQYRYLFHEALYQFIKNETFDIFQAYKARTEEIQPYLQEVCQAAIKHKQYLYELVASSLVREIIRLQVPYVCPSKVFESLFIDMLFRVQRASGNSEAVRHIQSHFCRIAQKTVTDIAACHKSLLKSTNMEWTAVISACCICLVHLKVNVLDCGHGLCDYCVRLESFTVHGTTSSIPCPLCSRVSTLLLKPKTAHTRALILPEKSAESMRLLLKELRRSVYGNLYEYFDIVVGSDQAVQPIIQMFCSDSSLRESPKWYRGRFRRQRRPKLSQLQPKQCKVALHQNCHLSTNYRQKALITDTDLGSISSNESRKLWPQSSLSTIVLEDISQVKEASRRMIASLFYVEITESLPVRCLPRVVGFRLCCRLMAGCHLQNLMVRLQDESAIVWYGCDQPIDNLMHQPLYNEARLEEMRYGKEYRMDFGVEIQSVNSIIQVRIGNVTWQEYISGCPYKFHRLVGDQESVIKDIAAGGCSDVNRRHVWRDSESRLQKEIDSLELLLRNI